MLNWFVMLHPYTGEPTTELICGECSHKFTWQEIQLLRDTSGHYSDNCAICEKNCGDYYHRKEAA